MIVPVLAIAGSFVDKIPAPPGAGSFPAHGFTFASLLLGTIVIVGALTYLPALVLGPVVEHFLMVSSNILF